MKYLSIAVFFLLIIFNSYAASQIISEEDKRWMLWENGVGKSRWFMYHLEKDDVLKLKEKWEEIGNSIESSTNEFSGTYYQPGYMSGYFLRWSPENGYVFVNYFDIEHPCFFSFEKVLVNGSEIKFIPEYRVDESRCPSNSTAPETWLPADGGKFLIPQNQVKEFADFYAGLREYNGFLRKIDGDNPFAVKWQKDFKPNKDFILPQDYEKFIKTPINAEIISVGKTSKGKLKDFFYDENVSVTPVQINVGRNNGVEKGMEFILLNSDDERHQTLLITSVSGNKSKGKVIRMLSENGKEEFSEYDYEKKDYIFKLFTPIEIGLKVTTSPISKL